MDEKRKQRMLRKITSGTERKLTPVELSVTEDQAHSSGETLHAPLRRTSIEVGKIVIHTSFEIFSTTENKKHIKGALL